MRESDPKLMIDDLDGEVLSLHRSGKSRTWIARILGINTRSVRRILKAAGIKGPARPRKRGGARPVRSHFTPEDLHPDHIKAIREQAAKGRTPEQIARRDQLPESLVIEILRGSQNE